jgi:hypothetical protein
VDLTQIHGLGPYLALTHLLQFEWAYVA